MAKGSTVTSEAPQVAGIRVARIGGLLGLAVGCVFYFLGGALGLVDGSGYGTKVSVLGLVGLGLSLVTYFYGVYAYKIHADPPNIILTSLGVASPLLPLIVEWRLVFVMVWVAWR